MGEGSIGTPIYLCVNKYNNINLFMHVINGRFFSFPSNRNCECQHFVGLPPKMSHMDTLYDFDIFAA